MQPTAMRLLGATPPDLPRAEAGIMEGKTAAESASPVVCLRNCRRVEEVLFILISMVWSTFQNRSRRDHPDRARRMTRDVEGRKPKIAAAAACQGCIKL